MPTDDPLFDTDGASEYLGIAKPATLIWWRHVGKGPSFVKPGGRVFYRRSALDAFVERGKISPADAA